VSCFGSPALLLSDLGRQRESFADGGLSFATPTASTLARRSMSALRPEQLRSRPGQPRSNLRLEPLGSCATENFDPGRSHNLRSVVVQFNVWIGLLAIAPFALGQSEPKNAAVVNGETTISYMEPARIAVATEGRPSRGAPDAPVTIVEFSDFECPYCATMFSTLKASEKYYKEQVRN